MRRLGFLWCLFKRRSGTGGGGGGGGGRSGGASLLLAPSRCGVSIVVAGGITGIRRCI